MRISDWSSDVCSSDLLSGLWQPCNADARPWHRRLRAGEPHLCRSVDPRVGHGGCDGQGGVAEGAVDSGVADGGGRLCGGKGGLCRGRPRSEEHTSELQSLMRISYAVFCLKKKKQ